MSSITGIQDGECVTADDFDDAAGGRSGKSWSGEGQPKQNADVVLMAATAQ